jgi:hypothetical protein
MLKPTATILFLIIAFTGQAQHHESLGAGIQFSKNQQSYSAEIELFSPYMGGPADGFASEKIIDNDCLKNLSVSAFTGGSGDGNAWNLVHQAVCLGSYLPEGKLLNWDAQCEKSNVELSWTMLSETNNAFFQIERSIDELKWQQVANIEAIGINRLPQHYTLRHNDALKGISFYRLKLIMRDGSFEYAPVIAIECEKGEEILLFMYPNPTQGTLIISGFGVSADLHIFNMAGQAMIKTIVEDDVAELQLDQLDDGIYFIRINSGNASINRKLVIKR